MGISKLSATGLRMAINDEAFSASEVLLMRDGRDVHTELERRGKPLTTHTATFQRNASGELTVTLVRDDPRTVIMTRIENR